MLQDDPEQNWTLHCSSYVFHLGCHILNFGVRFHQPYIHSSEAWYVHSTYNIKSRKLFRGQTNGHISYNQCFDPQKTNLIRKLKSALPWRSTTCNPCSNMFYKSFLYKYEESCKERTHIETGKRTAFGTTSLISVRFVELFLTFDDFEALGQFKIIFGNVLEAPRHPRHDPRWSWKKLEIFIVINYLSFGMSFWTLSSTFTDTKSIDFGFGTWVPRSNNMKCNGIKFRGQTNGHISQTQCFEVRKYCPNVPFKLKTQLKHY